MTKVNALRQEAERKRLMAQSFEERDQAQLLRNRANQAEQRAKKLAQEAQSDDLGGIIGVVVLIMIAVAIFG